MRLAVSCLFAIGCGRIGFAPATGDGGSTTDAADASDAPSGDAVSACQSWGPYTGTVDDTLSLGGTDDWLPRVSRDGLTLIVDTYNEVDFDLLMSRRPTTADTFPMPTQIPGVATVGATEQAGQLSVDESRLYLFFNNGTGPYQLWQYTRSGDTYTPELQHTLFNDQQHFWVSDDELRLYTLELRGSQGALMMAQRADVTAPFSAGVDLLVRAGKAGMSIALSPDELEMLMSMPMVSATADLDLFYTKRTAIGEPFGALVPLTELNTGFDDVVGSWSTDLATAYLNLDTDVDGGRDADVTIATRPCLD